jgi:predicted DNA-binding ribbon-helix-helix protein
VNPSRLVNRNVTASHGRTSMRLEPELWNALEEMCQRERTTIGEVVRRLEQRGHPGGRTSAVRVHVLDYFRAAATETGHRMAAHGPLHHPPADPLPIQPLPRQSAPAFQSAQAPREPAPAS